REAIRPTSLPAPWPYYAFYWGSNAKASYPEMPRDTFWALGLGDSIVVVCPSLDLVAVRLGVGSRESQLPGGEDWGGRGAGFFRLITEAAREPYPRSSVIREITWAPAAMVVRKAWDSDCWPLTWGDDDALY